MRASSTTILATATGVHTETPHVRSLPLARCGLIACSLATMPAWTTKAHGDDLQQVSIEANGIHEMCVQLTPRQHLHYTFTATSELAFNIHYHTDADEHAIYPVAEHLTRREDASFTADSTRHYCLMWTNPHDSDIELSVQREILTEP